MTTGLPELPDALPGSERMCRRAADRLASREPGFTGVVEGIVGVLEAAGGPDVANCVRAHLERMGDRLPASFADHRLADDRPRERILTSALRLYLAAEDDLRVALAGAGLSSAGQVDAAGGAAAPQRERAAFAERVLTARCEAVQAVLGELAAGELRPGNGTWTDALLQW